MNCVSRLALPLALVAAARAQSLNVDIGATAGTNPSVAYGAAANQPGHWNWFNCVPAALGALQPLSPLAGGAPVASVRFVAGNDGNFSFDNPATIGDAEALMDDVHDIRLGEPAVYEFHGLAPGGYWLYTYAMAPDDPNYRTEVAVLAPPSDDPPQVIGGAWPPGHEYQRTFAKHFVALPAGGILRVRATVANAFGSVNGFQLVFGGAGACDGEIDRYCTAKVDSGGCVPTIGWAGGPPSAGACGCGFLVRATNVLRNRNGLMFFSLNGPRATPFLGGTLCVEPPLRRTAVQNSGGAAPCGGTFSLDFNPLVPLYAIAPGDSVWTQWYYRDPTHPDGSGTGLSDALHFTVCF
jgi:hypothetical protein